MRIRHSGNVGIGVTSPNERLEVLDNIRVSGGTPRLRLHETNGPTNSNFQFAVVDGQLPVPE